MERFIGNKKSVNQSEFFNLKSSMERFIVNQCFNDSNNNFI